MSDNDNFIEIGRFLVFENDAAKGMQPQWSNNGVTFEEAIHIDPNKKYSIGGWKKQGENEKGPWKAIGFKIIELDNCVILRI